MNILKNKRFVGCFLVLLMFSGTIYVYAQEETKQQSETENLEQVKNLLDEGFEYLQLNAFEQAKSKFEEALKIAPAGMTEEIKGIIARSDEMANKKKALTEDTIIKGEEESKKTAELKQNIIQFEKEQKKKTYIDKGTSYYEQEKYEEALFEFNKILVINPKDKDAIAYIEKTQIAMEKSKKNADIKETLERTGQMREYWDNAKRYYRSKQYDESINELKKILAINPTDTEAIKYMELAEEMKLFGAKTDNAEKLENMVNKGKEYLRDKEYDKAIEIWGQVLKEKEDYPGIEILISQAEVSKAKAERIVDVEKEKAEREKKWLKVDEAYVPVVGGVKEEKKGKTVEDEEALAIEEITKKAKEKKVSLEFTGADLRSVILFLSKQSGINMMIDEAIFEAAPTAGVGGVAAGGGAGVGGPPGAGGGGGAARGGAGVVGGAVGATTTATPEKTYNITASLRDMPLSDVLSLVLRPKGLDYEIYPNVIWISTRDRLDNVPLEALETRIFDLQSGSTINGQIQPTPMQLSTITFGQSNSSGGSSNSSSGN